MSHIKMHAPQCRAIRQCIHANTLTHTHTHKHNEKPVQIGRSVSMVNSQLRKKRVRHTPFIVVVRLDRTFSFFRISAFFFFFILFLRCPLLHRIYSSCMAVVVVNPISSRCSNNNTYCTSYIVVIYILLM